MPSVIGHVAKTVTDLNYGEGILLPAGCATPGNLILLYVAGDYQFFSDNELEKYCFIRYIGGGTGGATNYHFDTYYHRVTGDEGWVGDGTDVLGTPNPGTIHENRYNIYVIEDAGTPLGLTAYTYHFPDSDNRHDPPPVAAQWDSGLPSLAFSSCLSKQSINRIITGSTNFAYDDTFASANGRPDEYDWWVGHEEYVASGLTDPTAYGLTGSTTSGAAYAATIIVPPASIEKYHPWDIGRCTDNPPPWVANCWKLSDSSDWELSGTGTLRMIGVDGGGDGGPFPADGEVLQEDPGPYGPWSRKHVARIKFRYTMSVASVGKLFYQWSIAAPVGDLGADIEVRFDGLTPSNHGVSINGGAVIPVVMLPSTDYILEVDLLVGIKVRVAEPAAIDDAPYLAATDYGPSYVGPLGFRGEAYEGFDVFIEEMNVSMGPASGAEFKDQVVGIGDGSQDTYTGFPTVYGTVEWRINGLVVEPDTYDNETGVVTFTREVDYGMVITQTGRAI